MEPRFSGGSKKAFHFVTDLVAMVTLLVGAALLVHFLWRLI